MFVRPAMSIVDDERQKNRDKGNRLVDWIPNKNIHDNDSKIAVQLNNWPTDRLRVLFEKIFLHF